MGQERDTHKKHWGTCANMAHYGLYTSLEDTSLALDLQSVRNQHSAALQRTQANFSTAKKQNKVNMRSSKCAML